MTGFLQSGAPIGYAFSVDVEDLFYSVPHGVLFEAVRECIDENGAIGFQNSAGVSVDNFISLLEFYLKSTFISFGNGLFLQRRGICIGSCVAPVLCNIFLAAVDRALHKELDDKLVLKAFRYVDDFLVVLNKQYSDAHRIC